MKYRVIDFHSHAFPEAVEEKAVRNLGEYYSLEMPCRGRIQDLLESAAEGNIEKLVVHATATRAGQVENVNNWIASITNDDNIIGFGTLHPDYPHIKEELDRIERLGLKGIKLHPEFQAFDIDDPRMYPIYEEIGSRLPVLFHMGDENLDYSSPSKLAKVLELFPKLKVVAAHLGGYARWNEVRQHLIGKDFFMDTSSSLWRLEPGEAVDIIRSHGADKVFFGTDYPIASHRDELNRFMNLALTEEEREMILFKNACNFLNLQD
ncbi:MAG: uncharacterized protein PWR27_1075 [Petroclostridium sp.]|jgi:hypothetical protein|nr:amidohydrolase 2 [Clostridia bacterium]MDK2810366.1 uncharacterized protein [Petroclostridium sp.]